MFAYDLSIIHRPATMMKNGDTISRHPNLLIGQYLTNAYILRNRDLRSRQFAYNYDVFNNSSNPRHVKAPARVLVATTPSTPTPAVICHFSLQFLQSPSLFHPPTNGSPTSNIFISPEQCTWFSFDSIIPSFSSLLFSSPARTLHRFVFQINTHHYRIAYFLSSKSTVYYTTLQHLYYHLLQLSHFNLHHISHITTSQQYSDTRLHYLYRRYTLDCSNLSTVSCCSTNVSDLSNQCDITMPVLSVPYTTVTDRNSITVNVAYKFHSMKLNRLKYRLQVALYKHNTNFLLPD